MNQQRPANMDGYEHISAPQDLTIPFQVPHRGPCTVSVHIEPDNDPTKHGQTLLDIYPDPLSILGFPILNASVSSPESRTYAAIYGWIQITYTPGEDWVMDIYPLFQDLKSPFAFWGAEPQMVDLPGRDLSKDEWKDIDHDWTARTFLCYSPDAAMTKTVVPILAFEWGWWLRKGGKVFVKKAKVLNVETWNDHVGLLRGKYEGWDFREVSREKEVNP